MKEPTETDFTHSVDREIIRQVGDLNFRGLSLIRQNLISSDPASSIVACTDRSLWSALNDASLKQVAEAPYLLFELPFDPILSVDDERADDRNDSDTPAESRHGACRERGLLFGRDGCADF